MQEKMQCKPPHSPWAKTFHPKHSSPHKAFKNEGALRCIKLMGGRWQRNNRSPEHLGMFVNRYRGE